MSKKLAAWGILPVAVTLALSGCGGSSSGDDAADDGGGSTIQVGTISGALPYQGLDDDGETVIGYEPDLIREAAKRIGMEVEFTLLGFDALLPGVSSGRFDVAQAGFNDKPERQAKYDMLDVANDQFTFGALPDVAPSVKTLDDLCGKKIGALAGGIYLAIFENQDKKCQDEGQAGVDISIFDADEQGYLAVKSGQIDLYPSSVPIIAYWAENNGGAVAPVRFLKNASAFVLPKDSPLTPKLQEALQEMVDDGTYGEILEKWNVTDIARDEITVNAGEDVME